MSIVIIITDCCDNELQVRLNGARQLRDASAGELSDLLTVLVENESGNARYILHVRNVLTFINVNMKKDRVQMLLGELLKGGRNALAGTTPFGREVYDDLHDAL